MRVLVLGGAGAVCKEATRDLAQTSEFEEIVVADANLNAAQSIPRVRRCREWASIQV